MGWSRGSSLVHKLVVACDCLKSSKPYGGKRFQSYKPGAVASQLGLGDKGSVASSPFNFASLHKLGSQRLSKLGDAYRYCLQDCQLPLSIWQELSLSRTEFATSWLCKAPIEFMASGSTGRAAETFVIGELWVGSTILPGMRTQGQAQRCPSACPFPSPGQFVAPGRSSLRRGTTPAEAPAATLSDSQGQTH